MCRMFVFEYIMKKFKWLKKIFGSQIYVCVIRYLNDIEFFNYIKILYDNRYIINVIISFFKKVLGVYVYQFVCQFVCLFL